MTEWLNQYVGEAIAPYATIAIALAVVFILIAVLFRILRILRSGAFRGGGQARLGIVEAVALEGERRIVLIRRDNVEHLLMIGGENDIVIETGIERGTPASAPVRRQPQPLAAAIRRQSGDHAVSREQETAQAMEPAAAQPRPEAAAPQPAVSQTPALAPATPASPPLLRPSSRPAAPSSSFSGAKPASAGSSGSDSAKIDREMNRLLDQIAGD